MPPKLHPTDDDLLIMRGGKSRPTLYKRPCAHCGKPAWMRREGRFCSKSCAMLNQNRSGANSPNWIGDDAAYSGRHIRVYAARGKADHCSLRPGLSNCTSTKYEWAQIHGTDGLDVREYVSLCHFCHAAYDRSGSRHPQAKLTEAIVLECRERSAVGEAKRALAREFGVAQPVMRHAISGKTWKHVPMPLIGCASAGSVS